MDDLIKGLTFPSSRDFLKTDKQYHDILSGHVQSLDGLIRKHQSLISSNPEKILSVSPILSSTFPLL